MRWNNYITYSLFTVTHYPREFQPSVFVVLCDSFEHQHRYGHHGRRHHILRPPRGLRGRYRGRDQKGVQEKGHAAPSSASCSHLTDCSALMHRLLWAGQGPLTEWPRASGIESDVSCRTPMILILMRHSNVSAKRTKRFRIPMTSVPSFLSNFYFPFPHADKEPLAHVACNI